MKRFIFLALGLCLVFPLTVSAADKYPSKPIQAIIPASPGGDTDLYCRILSPALSKALGKQLVVVNVSGGGGSTGTNRVKDAAPDGYTVLFFHNSALLNSVFGVTKYTVTRDFDMAAVAVVDTTNCMTVNAESRFKSLKEMAAEIKAKPNTVIFAGETGAYVYMMGVMFEKAAGGKFKMVDVGANAQKIAAMVGNQIDASMLPGSLIKGFLQSKKFRGLAMMSEKRHPSFPDIPTFKEMGFNLVDSKSYYFAFPKGTPKDVIKTFNAALQKALKDPETVKKMNENYLSPSGIETDKAVAYLDNLQKNYQKVADEVKAEAAKK